MFQIKKVAVNEKDEIRCIDGCQLEFYEDNTYNR